MGKTIAFVGSSGHIGFGYDPALESAEFDRLVFAPGSSDDNMNYLYENALKHGKDAALYADWRELLKNEKPFILVNCTVCAYMAEINIAFLKAGAHVLCEKPLCRTVAEWERLEVARRESGKVLLAMLNFRFEHGFAAAYKAVRDGAIGEVRLLNAQKSYKLGKRPSYFFDMDVYGGTIPWVGAHAVDFIQFMSREHPVAVAGFHSARENGGHGELDVSACCSMMLTNEVVATVTVDYFRPGEAKTHGDDRVRAVGTKGILEVREEKCYLLTAGDPVVLPDPEHISLWNDFLGQVNGEKPVWLSPEESVENALACLGARTAAETGVVYHF